MPVVEVCAKASVNFGSVLEPPSPERWRGRGENLGHRPLSANGVQDVEVDGNGEALHLLLEHWYVPDTRSS